MSWQRTPDGIETPPISFALDALSLEMRDSVNRVADQLARTLSEPLPLIVWINPRAREIVEGMFRAIAN